LRGASFAKPQAVCIRHWTIDLFKIGKIGAVLKKKPYELTYSDRFEAVMADHWPTSQHAEKSGFATISP
jgi:hypothetical protein